MDIGKLQLLQQAGIDRLQSASDLELGDTAAKGELPTAPATFGEALHEAIGAVEGQIQAADQAATAYIGGEGDLHTAMLAIERADVSFQTLVQVRNKLLEAYKEIMRMQV